MQPIRVINYMQLIVFYILGFLLEIILVWTAARQVAKISVNYRYLCWLLMFLAGLTFLVLISTFPRYISNIYSIIHDDLGIVLYGYEFILSIWFVIKTKLVITVWLLIVESAGSIIGLLSILKIIHLLFVGQFFGALAFGIMLIIAYPLILNQHNQTEKLKL